MHTQAWRLRRCISEFNGICRRPHWPREDQIRALLKLHEIELPERKLKEPGDEDEVAEDEGQDYEEDLESEAETVDAEVEDGSGDLSHSF